LQGKAGPRGSAYSFPPHLVERASLPFVSVGGRLGFVHGSTMPNRAASSSRPYRATRPLAGWMVFAVVVLFQLLGGLAPARTYALRDTAPQWRNSRSATTSLPDIRLLRHPRRARATVESKRMRLPSSFKGPVRLQAPPSTSAWFDARAQGLPGADALRTSGTSP